MPGPEFTNPIQITSARSIVSAQPVDDRVFYDTIADVSYAITNLKHFTKWHKYMAIYIREINQVCIWVANDDPIIASTTYGTVAIPGTTHQYTAPPYTGKTYNFYPIRAVALPHTHELSDITNLDITDYVTQTELVTELAAKLNKPALANGSYILVVSGGGSTLTWTLAGNLTPPTITGNLYAYRNGWEIIQNLEEGVVGQVSRPLLTPKYLSLPAGNYNLENPATLTPDYSMIIFNNGSIASNVFLNAYAIEGWIIPFGIPPNQSIYIAVINSRWRLISYIA
jgi:hypothetical protein